MLDDAVAADMTVYPYVVRRICEDQGGALAGEHGVVGRSLKRGAAIEAVVVEEPKIAGQGYGGDVDHLRKHIGLVIGFRAAQDEIHLGGVEPDG